MQQTRTITAAVLVLVFAVGLSGCSLFNELSNTEKGAAAGAAGGAVVGGAVGKATGSTARGAILGAVVGGTAGAIIGQRMDRQAEELEEDLPNAQVERVGEGIQVTFDSGILFDFDSSTLRSEAQANLDDLAASLSSYSDTEVLILGHTDSRGNATYNQGLSERRATSAASQLMERGIRPSRITTVGKGEEEPVATNDSEEGRQLNRRVEIAIYASEELRQELQDRH